MMVAVPAHVEQRCIVHPPRGIPAVPRPQAFDAPIVPDPAGESVMGDIIEALQHEDRDNRDGGEKGECTEADRRDRQGERGFDCQIADHAIAQLALGFECPCLAELTHGGTRHERIQAFAEPRRRRVRGRRRPPVVAVHVGNPELHVENATEQSEAECALAGFAAVNHFVRGDEAKDTGHQPGREGQAGRLQQACRRLCDPHGHPRRDPKLKEDVDAREPPRRDSARLLRRQPAFTQDGVQTGDRKQACGGGGEGPCAAKPLA